MDLDTTVTVRRIRPDDGPASRALRLEALADTPIAYLETREHALASPPTLWDDRARAGAVGDDRASFVADAGTRLVGTITGVADDQSRTWVVGVYLAPAWRGMGIVDRMVEAVATWSAAAGRDQLMLEVARQNPRAAASYTKLGFVPTGRTSAHPLYEGVVEQEMTRPARWSARVPPGRRAPGASPAGPRSGRRAGESPAMTRWRLLRAAVNWVNLSTPLGLLVARAGGAAVRPGTDGIRVAVGYRPPFPVATAFTVGNVVLTRRPEPPSGTLLAHETRHASQYALLGPLFLPAYGLCAAWSWALTGDWGARNLFERLAGLADGGYTRRPLRAGLTRLSIRRPPR
jgi:ribosomal protein S18 acetylase RimI-like enzyme